MTTRCVIIPGEYHKKLKQELLDGNLSSLKELVNKILSEHWDKTHLSKDQVWVVGLLADSFTKYYGKGKAPKPFEEVFEKIQSRGLNVIEVMDQLVKLGDTA